MLTLQIRKGKDFFWRNNKKNLHRIKGPASATWYKNGQKYHEAHYLNGRQHRLNGPASISWRYNGQKWHEDYYLNGVKRAHPPNP